jgi:hypothetical protein
LKRLKSLLAYQAPRPLAADYAGYAVPRRSQMIQRVYRLFPKTNARRTVSAVRMRDDRLSSGRSEREPLTGLD